MTRTKFVTKDNVHEATDVPRIRSLMENAERLDAAEVIEKCMSRLQELNSVQRKNTIRQQLAPSEHSILDHTKKLALDSSNNFLSQTIEIKRKNFQRYNGIFDQIFSDLDVINLSRQNVFALFEKDVELGMLASIAWGFQKGTLPGGKTLNPFISNFSSLKDTLNRILETGLTETLFSELNSHKEVKNGITTKLLYFSGAKYLSTECLIYDSRVKTYLEHFRPSEFSQTLSFMKKSQPVPTYDLYTCYCTEMNICSNKSNVPAGALEMFMFTNAPGKRPAQHKIRKF